MLSYFPHHLGQFQHMHLEVVPLGDRDTDVSQLRYPRPGPTHGWEAVGALGLLKHGDQLLMVSMQDKRLKDSVGRRHAAQCWVLPKPQVESLLSHPYDSYVVKHM